MLVPKSNQSTQGIRKHTVERHMRIGKISSKFLMTGLLAALALLYLAQSTQSAGRSYELRALDEQRTELEKERDRLEIESIRLRSLNEIQKVIPTESPEATATPAQVSWEPVHEVAYPLTQTSIAQRQ